MSTALRVLLLIGAVSMFLYVFRGVKKARFRAEETFFWLLLSLIFVILSIFPGIAEWAAGLLGVMSTVNLVFLLVIFLLLVKLFTMERKVVETDHQLTQLIKNLAISELESKQNGSQENAK